MHDTNYSYISNTVQDCIMYLLCPIKYKLETEFKLELYTCLWHLSSHNGYCSMTIYSYTTQIVSNMLIKH